MIVSTTKARKLLKQPKLKTRGDGKPSFYVLSEKKPHRNLGGPFTKAQAEKRLAEVEAHKNMGKKKAAKKKASKKKTAKKATAKKKPQRQRTRRARRKRSKFV